MAEKAGLAGGISIILEAEKDIIIICRAECFNPGL